MATDNPSSVEQLIEQAHLALLRHQYTEASDLLQQAIQLEPGNIDAQRLIALVPSAPAQAPAPQQVMPPIPSGGAAPVAMPADLYQAMLPPGNPQDPYEIAPTSQITSGTGMSGDVSDDEARRIAALAAQEERIRLTQIDYQNRYSFFGGFRQYGGWGYRPSLFDAGLWFGLDRLPWQARLIVYPIIGALISYLPSRYYYYSGYHWSFNIWDAVIGAGIGLVIAVIHIFVRRPF